MTKKNTDDGLDSLKAERVDITAVAGSKGMRY